MYWSTFCRWFNENRSAMPASIRVDIHRAAVARYRERISAGHAFEPLTFDDLIAKGEAAIAGH